MPESAEHILVQKGSVENRVVATGKVVARSTANLAFSRSGSVAQVLVKEGERVKAGQSLLILDVTELQLSADQQYANYLSVQQPTARPLKVQRLPLNCKLPAHHSTARKPAIAISIKPPAIPNWCK